MADMTREEAFDKIDLLVGKEYCGGCITRVCDACKIRQAFMTIKNDLKKLSAYENADLIERSKVIKEIEKRMPYQDTEFDGGMMEAVNIISDLPRFELKGSENND